MRGSSNETSSWRMFETSIRAFLFLMKQLIWLCCGLIRATLWETFRNTCWSKLSRCKNIFISCFEKYDFAWCKSYILCWHYDNRSSDNWSPEHLSSEIWFLITKKDYSSPCQTVSIQSALSRNAALDTHCYGIESIRYPQITWLGKVRFGLVCLG